MSPCFQLCLERTYWFIQPKSQQESELQKRLHHAGQGVQGHSVTDPFYLSTHGIRRLDLLVAEWLPIVLEATLFSTD